MRSLPLVLLGAATLLGAAGLPAQPPTAAPRPGVGRQGERPGGVGRREGRGGRGAMGPRAALRGIALSDAQRAQLRAVADRYRTERRTLADQARAQWGGRARRGEAGQGAAARPDSAARAAFRARVQDLRQRQVADVRAVLTAEQRATFDRNVAALRTRAAESRPDGGRRGAGRGFRGVR
jgi:Spy/CpxP family protein refolding chaperone